MELGMGRLAKEVLPKLSYLFLPRVHRAVGSWNGILEGAIVAHELHQPCDIVTVESFVEL